MRISDWSSDVCSSDLGRTAGTLSSFQLLKEPTAERQAGACGLSVDHGFLELDVFWPLLPEGVDPDRAMGYFRPEPSEARCFAQTGTQFPARKRAGEGKGGSVRGDTGGRRDYKKNKHKKKT